MGGPSYTFAPSASADRRSGASGTRPAQPRTGTAYGGKGTPALRRAAFSAGDSLTHVYRFPISSCKLRPTSVQLFIVTCRLSSDMTGWRTCARRLLCVLEAYAKLYG